MLEPYLYEINGKQELITSIAVPIIHDGKAIGVAGIDMLLAGLNDSPAAAWHLADWLAGLRVHVNLIPYNPIDGAPHLAGSDRRAREAFGAILKSTGLKTTIRYSLGADIAAACGQLVRRENRRQQRSLASGQVNG